MALRKCSACKKKSRVSWSTYCKPCSNKKVIEWKKQHREQVNVWERRWAQRWRKDNQHYYETRRDWQKKNPLKIRAYSIVQNALKKGVLKKLGCEHCGSKNVHAHHSDHTKPLLVEWLCPLHHRYKHLTT